MGANVTPGPRTAELNGLNPHGHVPPYTLSMTSLPPIFPVLAAGDVDVDVDVEVLVEDPPQAATNRHTAANDMSPVKRFIDTLRSRFNDRQVVTGSDPRVPHLALAEVHLANT
jgi:hypothetical protein